jgi:dCMP deaminase
MIIGLTGKNASGKGEVARFLREGSFQYVSLSDEIREELIKEKLPVTRENMIEKGNFLRSKYGLDILSRRVYARMDLFYNYVVDSFRNPREVEFFRQFPDFALIRLEAPLKMRFKRVLARDRGDDPETLEAFRDMETREYESADTANQQLLAVMQLADFTIENDGTIEDLEEKCRIILQELFSKVVRPSWDEYFMSIARVVASRSNCVKRRVAAIVVKDRRIISTGYNGTPRGVKNCNEGGCPRCNQLTAGGTDLGECLCSHGEENAITQAAYHGISIKDATMYTTFAPCLMCTKMIINAGIREVVYNEEYPLNDVSFSLLKEAGVEVRKVSVK